MTNHRPRRRTVLQTAASLALLQGAAPPTPAAAAEIGRGEPGQFDFLQGAWRIHHRRLKAPGDWDVFEGEATCWSILGGVASIEELRISARNFSGMGLRLLDVERAVWADFWVNAKSGVLTPPPTWGGFKDGAGVFDADDLDGDKPIKIRGVWDQITATSCRWRQAISCDGGATWDDNWLMDWRWA